jgi:hypothetical protein
LSSKYSRPDEYIWGMHPHPYPSPLVRRETTGEGGFTNERKVGEMIDS